MEVVIGVIVIAVIGYFVWKAVNPSATETKPADPVETKPAVNDQITDAVTQTKPKRKASTKKASSKK